MRLCSNAQLSSSESGAGAEGAELPLTGLPEAGCEGLAGALPLCLLWQGTGWRWSEATHLSTNLDTRQQCVLTLSAHTGCLCTPGIRPAGPDIFLCCHELAWRAVNGIQYRRCLGVTELGMKQYDCIIHQQASTIPLRTVAASSRHANNPEWIVEVQVAPSSSHAR
jgi:hypothetical protein